MANYDEFLCSYVNTIVIQIDYETLTRASSKHVIHSVHFRTIVVCVEGMHRTSPSTTSYTRYTSGMQAIPSSSISQ